MLTGMLGTTTPTTTPVVQADEPKPPIESIDNKIIRYADVYGVNAKSMRATLVCESGLNPKAHNPNDPSFGIAQFLKPTFYHYARILGITDPDIWDVDQQLQIMAYLFSTGEAKQWTCWRQLH